MALGKETRGMSKRNSCTQAVAAVALAGVLAFAPGARAQFAEASASGQSLRVPSALANSGTVYHALIGGKAQIHFTSEAPLETIKGQSSAVIGFAVAGSSGNPADLKGGEWHLPVNSLHTGIELRDEHLASKQWLNAKSFPDIVFQIKRVDGAQQLKSSDAFTTYTATLVGTMTIHGVTNDISIPDATIIFLKASSRTKSIAKGDLMAIRAKYYVSLSDYEVSHPVLGKKVADTVEIDTQLFLSTVPPERQ